MKAQLSGRRRFLDKGISLRSQLELHLSRMGEEDDWRFGAEFRMEGQQLMKQALKLDLDYDIAMAAVKSKSLNILEKEKRQQIERTHLSTVIHSEKLWRHRVALWLDKAKRKLDMSYGHL